jgi:inositol hexakisphosphate/diphosphoinositol-pentakisphosphate kinase
VTAAAFARGLLQLDNDIPPILASLVRKDEFVNKLLDDVSSATPLVF